MYYLPSNCFICLKNEDSPTIELRNAKNNKVEQITYVLPELVNFYTKINVCSECYTTLQSFYIFKKKCLKNCTYIKNYVSTLQISKNDDKQGECDFKIKVNKNELVTRLDKEKTVEINDDDDVHIKEEVVEQPVFVSCGTEMHNGEHDSNIVKVKEEPVFGESQEQMDTDECFVKQEPEVNIVDINEDNEIEDISSSAEDNTNFHEDSSEENSKTTDILLPGKSKRRYIKVYTDFKDWCAVKKVTKISENVLLAYFQELAHDKKPSSQWVIYSMLKSTLLLKDSADISKYFKLVAFLKHQNVAYKPKKSSAFSKEEIFKFLIEAPDFAFLSTKALFVIGLAGGCRTDELCNMQMDDIEIQDNIIFVNIRQNENRSPRKFVLIDPLWVRIAKKYLGMRPNPDMQRVFIGFRNGKPTRQNIGHNTISAVPKTVATFLKLPNPQNYTGHSLRRTSASILT